MKLNFEEELEDINFPFLEVADERDNFKTYLGNYAIKMVNEIGHYILLIDGKIGSGKTISSLSLATDIDDSFNIERIVFNVDELEILVEKDLPPKSVIIFKSISEPKMTLTQWSKHNEKLDSLLELIQMKHLIFIIITENANFIPDIIRCKINGYATTIIPEDHPHQYGWVKYFNVKYNKHSDKLIHRFLRKKDEMGRTQIIKGRYADSPNMRFTMPSESLVKEYKKIFDRKVK